MRAWHYAPIVLKRIALRYRYELKCRPTLAPISQWSRGAYLKRYSQLFFPSVRQSNTFTRGGHIPPPDSLPLLEIIVTFVACDGGVPGVGPNGAGLSGVVTDQTGAALPDVAVTIKNVDTGETRTIATDGGGHYQASGLPPGRFEIRAAKQGFADETRTGISLAAGQDATVDIKMQRSTPDACASGHEFATTDCTLTWHGITLYGAYDVGVGWVSHGLPENATNYEGESLVNRNGYLDSSSHRTTCQQTGLGIRGKEEFAPGWSVVFNLSTGINPQSGQLANASSTDIADNGLPRSSYSIRHRRRARGPTLQ